MACCFWDLVLVQVLGFATRNQIVAPLAEKEYYKSMAKGPHFVENSQEKVCSAMEVFKP